ncbi:hypothetical protein HC931_28130 [Candidatus Gracilibacteria bacterium]|nr:hypothetical protein [Candidatus Gracilibacteria bacterium]
MIEKRSRRQKPYCSDFCGDKRNGDRNSVWDSNSYPHALHERFAPTRLYDESIQGIGNLRAWAWRSLIN